MLLRAARVVAAADGALEDFMKTSSLASGLAINIKASGVN